MTEDINFVKNILPTHYEVRESKTKGSIHCKSTIGLTLPTYYTINGNKVEDAENEAQWRSVSNAIKAHFGKRFSEIFHNTCSRHLDFTIYLKTQ